jgi:hypothetical protein
MVEKFDGKDAKKSNFNDQMEFRKKSNLKFLKTEYHCGALLNKIIQLINHFFNHF